jgi:hypothetical protein
MVARIQINLIEVFGPHELIKEVVNSGNWYRLLTVILFRAQ